MKPIAEDVNSEPCIELLKQHSCNATFHFYFIFNVELLLYMNFPKYRKSTLNQSKWVREKWMNLYSRHLQMPSSFRARKKPTLGFHTQNDLTLLFNHTNDNNNNNNNVKKNKNDKKDDEEKKKRARWVRPFPNPTPLTEARERAAPEAPFHFPSLHFN